MQNLVVLAFRKRLKKRGYLNISIHKVKGSDEYTVTAVEPLAGVQVSRRLDLFDMNQGFRF